MDCRIDGLFHYELNALLISSSNYGVNLKTFIVKGAPVMVVLGPPKHFIRAHLFCYGIQNHSKRKQGGCFRLVFYFFL